MSVHDRTVSSTSLIQRGGQIEASPPQKCRTHLKMHVNEAQRDDDEGFLTEMTSIIGGVREALFVIRRKQRRKT
jgi:hypothetical protein